MDRNKPAAQSTLAQRLLAPRTGLKTTSIGFGGGAVSGEGGGYGFGLISESQAIEVLQYSYQRGVTLFDTAPIYGFGLSEKRIGLALAGRSEVRRNIVLVSKLGVTWDRDKKVSVNNSPETVKRQLAESLENLRTDYLDVYMIHWPDKNVPVEKTMEALLRAKEDGLIGHIGASNFSADLLERAMAVGPVDVLQGRFCAIDDTLKGEIFPACRDKKLGFMSYGTLAKGILAGTVSLDRQFDSLDFRGRGTQVQRQLKAVEPQLELFFRMAKELSVTPSQLAVAWTLSHPEVSVALCGCKSIAQVDEIVSAANVQIPVEFKVELDRLAALATPAFVSAG